MTTTKSAAIAALALVMSLTAAPAARAENWPQWRGPALNGSSTEKNLPEVLDKTTQVWEAPMPGPSFATPVVWGDRVFVSSLDPKGQTLLALCVSRTDGKVLWQKEVAPGFSKNGRNNMATPSPITDGKSVIFYYGTGDLAAFDLDGNELWKRSITKDHGQFNVLWIYGATGLLYKGTLYIPVLHRDVSVDRGARRDGGGAGNTPAKSESYLLAIDPATGKDKWKVVRPSEAREESLESYATPIPWERPGRTEILVVGGDCITGHDPETGKELWRAGDWNPSRITHWRLVPSAVVGGDDIVLVCPPKGGKIFAVKGGGSGDVTQTHKAWTSPDLTSDVCVPLVYDGKFYILDGDRKAISLMDAKTGKQLANTALGGGAVFRASPTGADGKIYCVNEAGDTWVVSADDLRVLGKSSLGGKTTDATIVVANGTVLVRTADKLYAFAKK